MSHLLPNWGHSISYRCLVCFQFSLHVWCHDLCMLPEVAFEGFTLPVTFCFDNVEGDSSQQVFQSGAYMDAVTGQFGQFLCRNNLVDSREEDISGHRSHCVLVFEGKEVAICQGVVDFQVVFKCCMQVNDAILLSPENLLTFLLGNLGPGEGNDHFLKIVVVLYSMLDVRGLDMYGKVEAIQSQDSDLAESGDSPEGSGKAGEDGSLFWDAWIEVITYVHEVADHSGFFLFSSGLS